MNENDNWVEGIAEFAEQQQLEREYPHIDFRRLSIALGVCLLILVVAATVL